MEYGMRFDHRALVSALADRTLAADDVARAAGIRLNTTTRALHDSVRPERLGESQLAAYVTYVESLSDMLAQRDVQVLGVRSRGSAARDAFDTAAAESLERFASAYECLPDHLQAEGAIVWRAELDALGAFIDASDRHFRAFEDFWAVCAIPRAVRSTRTR